MKRIIYLLIVTGTFLSCNNGTNTDDGGTGKRLDQSQALIHQFKPLINGVWIKKDYIKKVKKSKSPLEAVEKGTGITIMHIDTAALKGDSIAVPVIINNHEGSSVLMRYQPGKNTTTIELGADELSYKVKNGDTTLIIYHYSPQTKETATTQYIKAQASLPAGGLAAGINMMVNQAILSGVYEGKDAAGKSFKPVFTDDGKVTGLPGFSNYYVQIDLIADPLHSHDQMIFNLNAAGQKAYSFIINKKTLNLYNEGEGKNASDKPAYSLKRKRQ